jgi:hypothetical protein
MVILLRLFIQIASRYAIRWAIQEATGRIIGHIVSSLTHRPLDAANLPDGLVDVLDKDVIDEDPHVESDVTPTEDEEREQFEGAGEQVPIDPLDQFENTPAMQEVDEDEVQSENDEENNFTSESESDNEGDGTDLDPELEENYTIGREEEDSRMIADEEDNSNDDHDQQFADTSDDGNAAASAEADFDIFASASDDLISNFTSGDTLFASEADSQTAGMELDEGESAANVLYDIEADLLDPFENNDFDLIGDSNL